MRKGLVKEFEYNFIPWYYFKKIGGKFKNEKMVCFEGIYENIGSS